jgi:hypothetical protein
MSRSLRQVTATIVAAMLLIAVPSPAVAYLKLGTGTGSTAKPLHWPLMPVRYYVTDRGIPGVTASMLEGAVFNAAQSWQNVSSASITYQFGGFTSSLPDQDDGFSVLGFLEHPDLDHVLASTSFTIDTVTGELLESDIFFNASFDWFTSTAGVPGRFDLEAIALHEIGHMSGLGHSAIGETEVTAGGRRVLSTGAVMFPIAFPAGNASNRTLHADDIAGISDLYPDGDFSSNTGSLSGRVTKNGNGTFGAHVVATNPATGDLVGNFALDQNGRFSIAGLAPGTYIVRVEPLDDADVDGFFDSSPPLDLNFKVSFYKRLVVVPRGGDSGAIQVEVVAK